MSSEKKWFLKKVVIPLVIIIASILITIQIIKLKKEPQSIPAAKLITKVTTTKVNRVSESFIIKGNGTVTPLSKVNLLPQVSGKIIFVTKQMIAGGHINKGQTLFLIDTLEYHLRVQSAKAFLKQQEMLLTTEEENRNIAIFEWKEFKKNNPNEEPGLLTLRKPQFELAKANYNSALASLELAKLNLARTRIKAPFSGIVKDRSVDFGQLVGPGTSLGIVLNSEKLQIKIPVKRDEVEWLNYQKNGKVQPIEATIFAGNHQFKGQLVRIGAELNSQSRMIDLIIEATNIPNIQPQLLIGDFVKVELRSQNIENIFKLPRHLVDEKNMIKIVVDNKVKFNKVKILKILDTSVLISEGLNDGDQVIISILDVATPDMEVEIKE